MTNRTTDQEVRDIIPNTVIVSLTPFINAANTIVDRLAASACGSDLSDAELTQVEIWLSAHYAAISDPSLAVVSERFENATNTFSRGNTSTKGGILSTQYGQMANTLSSGCLVELDMRKASGCSIGNDVRE